MAAYIIVDITVWDDETFAKYRDLVPETVAKYGGRYLARTNQLEVLEGNWRPERLVVVEFPSAQRAKQWWNSEEYMKLRNQRQGATESRMIVVQGVQV
jgi:uncharacterized protein (DUF1330 family)